MLIKFQEWCNIGLEQWFNEEIGGPNRQLGSIYVRVMSKFGKENAFFHFKIWLKLILCSSLPKSETKFAGSYFCKPLHRQTSIKTWLMQNFSKISDPLCHGHRPEEFFTTIHGVWVACQPVSLDSDMLTCWHSDTKSNSHYPSRLQKPTTIQKHNCYTNAHFTYTPVDIWAKFLAESKRESREMKNRRWLIEPGKLKTFLENNKISAGTCWKWLVWFVQRD